MTNIIGKSVEFAKLYERRSRNDKMYLTGRLGMCHVAIVPTDEKTEDGKTVWMFKLQERPTNEQLAEIGFAPRKNEVAR